ncbi:hypothetical protein PHYSODRAFT_342460 [Phytophthora sojae]|uniref:Multidrug resistance protein ABC superfamily n=1 Tax=Phytophthora sojae (strain P6497) TaxID=1094619 RepID=G5AGL8_PHYSP|nr:hypothetical protein PHYSODRAFT_342460 [Phytophthora sojae]EGZ05298.1 hypothetical protein PHYSODRAFT_342460 [Phytophthora sojae]|eukprot:XP_009539219.1 hypothetical protein PHYSODRAFT_342460 [Phytophthora sojae]
MTPKTKGKGRKEPGGGGARSRMTAGRPTARWAAVPKGTKDGRLTKGTKNGGGTMGTTYGGGAKCVEGGGENKSATATPSAWRARARRGSKDAQRVVCAWWSLTRCPPAPAGRIARERRQDEEEGSKMEKERRSEQEAADTPALRGTAEPAQGPAVASLTPVPPRQPAAPAAVAAAARRLRSLTQTAASIDLWAARGTLAAVEQGGVEDVAKPHLLVERRFLPGAAVFVVGFIIGSAHGWNITLVMACVMPVMALSLNWMIKTFTIMSDFAQKVYAEAGSVAKETLGSIRTVASLNGEQKAIEKFESKIFKAETENIKLNMVVTVVYALFLASMWIMYSVGLCVSAVAKAAGAVEQLFAILDTASAIDAEKEDEGIIPDTCEGKIDAVNVNFTYPSRPDAQILRDYNVTIEPGQTVAFAGASGGGKSTLIALIERFYDPTSGTIYLDGRDVKTLNVKWLRSQIGMVSQEPVLFATTIFENIAMGGDNVTREEAIEACKLSNVHNFIMSLPEQYDTLVGEKGVSLSGGQKQRVAIARAIVRKPNILVLDEATSALDNESEKIVQAALNNLMATTNMTTLVIAHRLSTIRNADKIVVLNEGHIIEHGVYQNMYRIQELRSQEEQQEAEKREAENGLEMSAVENNFLDKKPFNLFDLLKLNGLARNHFVFGLVGSCVGGIAVPASALLITGMITAMTEQYALFERTWGPISPDNVVQRRRANVGFFDEKENATGALTADLATNATKVSLIWLLSLIMLVLFPMWIFGEVARMKEMEDAGLISDDLAIPGAHASEVLGNIRTVAALGIEKKSATTFNELLQEPLRKGRKEEQVSGLSLGFSSFIMMATYALVFWFGAKKVNDGTVGFAEMMRTLMAITMSIQTAGSTIYALRDRVAPIDSFTSDGFRLAKVEGRLEFKNISFRYPARPEINVLKNYNLTIEPGQTVAFCGPSGGGKSTIISGIKRFYDPVVGEELLDGRNIKDLNLNWLRSQMGLVGQEPTLFIGTIAENIAYGLAEQPSQQEIDEAAKMANAHDFITHFPDGYETQVGMKGEQLSGGQKQRIAIARHKRFGLGEVQEALDKVVALKRRTTIVIAHRLSTIRRADKICVVSGGKIAEQGTHQELLQLNGIYANLVESATA